MSVVIEWRAFEITGITIQDQQITLGLASTTQQANCPECGKNSNPLHGTCQRHPTDLPWVVCSVLLELHVKRFFCHNPDCPKRTFAEQFPDFVGRYARKTNRVLHKQQYLGVNVYAHVAEKMLRLEQIAVSDTTLNRILCCLPEPENHGVRVLGVDDWAKSKGQGYGTILVDLERSQIIDLLSDHAAESLIQWLGKHPEVQTVSRDRSQSYADAIEQASPHAIQLADRWHLLKNASDALFKILRQECSLVRKYLEPKMDATVANGFQNPVLSQRAENGFLEAHSRL